VRGPFAFQIVPKQFLERIQRTGYEDALFYDWRLTDDGTSIHFDIDPFLKQRLLNGWDQIGLTLRHENEITEYEREHGIG